MINGFHLSHSVEGCLCIDQNTALLLMAQLINPVMAGVATNGTTTSQISFQLNKFFEKIECEIFNSLSIFGNLILIPKLFTKVS